LHLATISPPPFPPFFSFENYCSFLVLWLVCHIKHPVAGSIESHSVADVFMEGSPTADTIRCNIEMPRLREIIKRVVAKRDLYWSIIVKHKNSAREVENSRVLSSKHYIELSEKEKGKNIWNSLSKLRKTCSHFLANLKSRGVGLAIFTNLFWAGKLEVYFSQYIVRWYLSRWRIWA